MFKSKILATLTLILAAVAVLSTMTLARTAFAAGDDVFMDEGDGDFDSMPAPATQALGAAKKAETTVPKIAEPRPAAPVEDSSEEMPILTDDSSPSMTPASTENSSSSPTVYPKEMKAKKKKPTKKASATAANEETPTASTDESVAETPHKKVASVAGGSFVTTKEACPMMRSPASTGETMLTVKASKKIWVEDAGESWVKAFNKAGEAGYVSRDCVQ